MLVKFIDKETMEVFKDYYIDGEIVYTNAEAEKLAKENGYKELIIENEPEYDNQTQYLAEYFEEQEDCIIKKWEVKENNQEG